MMIGRTGWSVAALLAIAGMLACGPSPEEKQARETAQQMEEAGRKIAAAMEQGGQNPNQAIREMQEAFSSGEQVEPVDFRDLKALLPASIAGLQRTEATGESSQALGIKVAQAEASYLDDHGAQLQLKITDLGSIKGIAAVAYSWALADYDRETESGYERTTTFEGHRAFERFDHSDSSGALHVIIADRFVVEATGTEISMSTLKTALGQIDLDELASLKSHGVE